MSLDMGMWQDVYYIAKFSLCNAEVYNLPALLQKVEMMGNINKAEVQMCRR